MEVVACEGWMRRGQHMTCNVLCAVNSSRYCCGEVMGGRRKRRRRRRRRQSGFTEEEILSSIRGRLRETGGETRRTKLNQ